MTVEPRPITDRESWLKWRTGFLTASDIGAIAGKSRFKTPLRVWNEKMGLVPDLAETPAMKRGRWLEAAAIEGLKEEHPDWLITRPAIFLADTEHKIGATPDAYVSVPGKSGTANCQIKCVGPMIFERYWADGVPTDYKLQTATEGMLLGAETNFVCALVVDSHKAEITLYEVPRAPSAELLIMDLAADFWRRIDENDPYPPDFARDSEIIRAMYPTAEPESVLDLTGDNRLGGLLERRAEKKEIISLYMKDIETIETEVKAKMGTAEVATLDGWKLTWKNRTIKEHLVKETISRPLLVRDLREEAT
jgi:putative phage-type endonuclease